MVVYMSRAYDLLPLTQMYQPVLYDDNAEESFAPSISKINARHLADGIMLILKPSPPKASCPQGIFPLRGPTDSPRCYRVEKLADATGKS